MNLLKRISNLWRLSEINVEKEEKTIVNFIDEAAEIKPKQWAKIIKMTDPLEKVLKKE